MFRFQNFSSLFNTLQYKKPQTFHLDFLRMSYNEMQHLHFIWDSLFLFF